MCIELVAKRDRMVQQLTEIGFKPIVPDGGYFILADFSDLGLSSFSSLPISLFAVSDGFKAEAKSQGVPLDTHFNNWMIKNMV